MSVSEDAVQAVTRFALGPDHSSLKQASAGAQSWLLKQTEQSPLAPELDAQALAGREAAAAAFGGGMQEQKARQEAARKINHSFNAMADARFAHHCRSDQPLSERLVMFWANHFALSSEKLPVKALMFAFEQEAIRPHIYGRFSDMVLASSQHPAMLIYLDNNRSFGPDSMAGKRGERGMNENLAREILELHTLGVDGGYTQQDVIGLAQLITGWTVARSKQISENGFLFRPQAHQPGDKQFMGQVIHSKDEKAGIEALKKVSLHPATAKHLATKLAAHFIRDVPPPEAVAQLSECFMDTQGDLKAMTQLLITMPQAWETPFARVKSPYEWLISVIRGSGSTLPPRSGRGSSLVIKHLQALNYPFMRPGSPAGFPDRDSYWMNPDALMKRIEWAFHFAQQQKQLPQADVLAEQLLGNALSAQTLFAVRNAPSQAEGLAALLVSPEFLRR